MTQEQLQEPAETQQNWTSTVAGKIIAGAVIATEVSPLNELVRYGALGAAIATQDSALVSAAVFTATTFAVEAPAALVTADALDTSSGNKAVKKLNGVLEARGMDSLIGTGPFSEFAVSLFAGSAITTVVKHRQNTDRSKSENRKFGIGSAAQLSLAMGIGGYLTARGIETPRPETVGGAALFIAGCVAVAKKALSRKTKDKENLEGLLKNEI